MAHALCILYTKGYKHTLRVYNISERPLVLRFSTSPALLVLIWNKGYRPNKSFVSLAVKSLINCSI
jgi:hypothetical protein